MQKLLLTMLLSLLIPLTAVAQEAYAVYTTDGTLTFYYDKQKSSRSGTKYALNTGTKDPGWYTDHRKDIKKAVFTSSFANARPTSTWEWFSVKASEKESALSDIVGIQYLNTSEVTNMGWMFAYCTKLQELDVSHFNTAKVTYMSGMFCDCSSLTTLDVSNFNTNKVTSMSAMFEGCRSLTSLNVSNFDTSNVTNFWYMFKDCSALKSINVSNFNTSKVTDFCAMFDGCSSLTTIDVSHFNTSNATRLNSMFSECSSLTSLDLSSFNTSKVTGMGHMFNGCKSLKNLNLSNFNSTNVTTMSGMFDYCSSLTSLDLSHLDTRNVGDMSWMFNGCTGLKSLDLSTFNTSKVTEMQYMFDGCTSLTTIYAGNNWSTNKVSDSRYMFRGCTSLVGGAGTKYNASHVDKAYAHIDGGVSNPGYLTDKNAPAPDVPYAVYNNGTLTFYYDKQKNSRSGERYELNTGENNPGWYFDHCHDIKKVEFMPSFANARPTSTYKWFAFDTHRGTSSLTTITGMQFLNTSAVTTMSYMFSNCSQLTSLDLSRFDTSNVKNMWCMFYGCSNLTNLDITSFNTNKVTEMSLMFYMCSRLKNLDVTKFNTSNVTRMSGMFEGCSGLTTLDVTHFNTDKVTMMNDMFSGCSFLTTLDVSHFNTIEVKYMEAMFSGCSGLKNIDVSHFDTSNVTYMDGMFYGCSGLTSLDLSNFNTSKVTKMYHSYYKGMFQDCTSLKTIYVGDGWNTENVTDSEKMFLNCTSLVGGAGTKYDANHVDKSYAHIDGGVSNPGYLTSKNAVPVEICSEDYLQQRLDEIAAQKPAEPVELTICPDGLTLTKSIHVDRDCKAIITGGPITSAASIEYSPSEGLFFIMGELGFKDISLKLTNDSKSDGCLGYFWLDNGKLLLGKGASVVTNNGTVVCGLGDLEMTDAVIQAGGEELVISDKVNATVTEYVFLVGEKTYCNGKLSVDMKTDANTGYIKKPIFLLGQGQTYVSSSLDLWDPESALRNLYLHKDAVVKTYKDGIKRLSITGEWEQMTLGRAFITSTSITQADYDRMNFCGVPTNRRTEFVANSHQVRLMSASQLSIQTQLAVLNNSSAAAAVTLNLSPEAVTVVNQSSTVNHKNVTFSGMQSGSGSRGRLHFADGQTLTITSGSSLTLTDIDVTGEGSNNGFIVNGKIVIGENVHVSDLPCLLHVGSSGRVLLSAQPVSVVTMEFIGGIANGQTIVAGTDGYQLTASDLEYIQVEGCELQLDEANNRIIAVNATGIESIAADTEAQDGAGEYYDLSGRRVATPRHGAYILRKDGKTRKIYIK